MHAWKNNALVSSNINEVIRIVLNFLIFFYENMLHAQKAQKNNKKHKKHKKNIRHRRHKKHKKHQKAPESIKNTKNITKQKHKNANNRINIKNALKNI